MNTQPRVGDRVRIQRDETLYPAKGTWPQFRGRTGTVVEINRDRAGAGPDRTEYGVEFGKVRKPKGNGSISSGHSVWFKDYEMVTLPPEVNQDAPK
jgi:hypothetical protein